MNRWLRAACIIWGIIVLLGLGRAALFHLPRHCGCYDVFADGGRHWLHQQPLFDLVNLETLNVFRYSPLVAAFCAPLALVSNPMGSALLRLVNFVVLLVGLTWWGKKLCPDG